MKSNKVQNGATAAALLAALLAPPPPASAQSPFAAEVLAYDPAPGQWVNLPEFSDPGRALGPPVGGGVHAPGNTSLVSLGGFGGSLTLRFENAVEDDPRNPLGLDAIVFGNAHWVGSPEHHWGECGIIEISLDANGNRLADDGWYLIPGSHLSWPMLMTTGQTWDDNVLDTTYPPQNPSWIPPGRFGVWTTSAVPLPAGVFARSKLTNPLIGTGVEGIHGYADYTPTLLRGDLNADNIVDAPDTPAEHFYTVPDDPMAVGITPASGGGDAFDIAWAIDPATGAPAGLPRFDFIRITNSVNFVAGPLGEISTEIDAVADVRPDPFGDADTDGDVDLADVVILQACYADPGGNLCTAFERVADGLISLEEAAEVLTRMSDPR